ncbi:hypothetical protein RND71_007733 [Anisodus tanguticus]|uniref:RRM domain-containing protein n=1 Tax=Anisodus tanguticus TaxID=243964 RepID=A0AAE1SMD2_9SOLA|nr:hypothetical protein RND71_007733 [Anisodus tanguticus]
MTTLNFTRILKILFLANSTRRLGSLPVEDPLLRAWCGVFIAHRISQLHIWMAKSYNGIEGMLYGLGIDGGDSIARPALRFYEIAVEKNFTRGRRKEQVQAACLYIACLFGGRRPNISRSALHILASMKRDWMQKVSTAPDPSQKEAHARAKESTEGKGSSVDKEKVLKVSWEKIGEDYTAQKLTELFSELGEVEDVVIKSSKKKGSALVVMSSKDAIRIQRFDKMPRFAARRRCCSDCGKVLEEDNFSSEPTFVKNAAGQIQLPGALKENSYACTENGSEKK